MLRTAQGEEAGPRIGRALGSDQGAAGGREDDGPACAVAGRAVPELNAAWHSLS